MLRSLKQLMVLVAIVFTFLFILFVINQTAQFVHLAANVSPMFAQVIFFVFLIFYAVVIIVPLIWISKMPRALFPPEHTDSDEYKAFIRKLGYRLSQNPSLAGFKVDSEDLKSIELSLKTLNKKADEQIKSTASSVFIMTAISQYGALDALIVLLAQFRMIWQVTTLYNQRPNLKELATLYSNVFATAFLASRIENLDLLEDQLEPVIASIMGSSLSSFTPAFSTAATVVTNSIIVGSANAFLTLRVGVITKLYCASLAQQEKKQLRRLAAVQAASLLGKVLSESAYTVSKTVFKAAARAGTRPFRYGQDLLTKATKSTWNASKNVGKSTMKKSEGFVNGLTDAVRNSSGKLFFAKKKKGECSGPSQKM